MTAVVTRRRFLAGGAAAAGIPLFSAGRAIGGEAPTILNVVKRTLEVNGRAAGVFAIQQPAGVHGLVTEVGRRFRVTLNNRLDESTLVHWHGLTPPSNQDGTPGLSQPPIEAGASHNYDFPLTRPGTYWMHSHLRLQEQRLLAAPLIVRDDMGAFFDEQEVVVMLHDFSFRDPEEIFAELTGGTMAHGGMDMKHDAASGEVDHAAKGHGAGHGAGPHLNDVEYDAYLANDRTLDDPEIASVEAGGRVRLRIINGSASTNFWLDLGALEGDLIAVDGQPALAAGSVNAESVRGRRFEIAVSQRLDIRLVLPAGQGAYPILARREGGAEQTGVILATKGAAIARLSPLAAEPAPALGLELERRLAAAAPVLSAGPSRDLRLVLGGGAMDYVWTLEGPALRVREGEHVRLTMTNRTNMSHPMHLHGHSFQIVAIDGAPLAGALRDTVLVPIDASVTIAFNADNPGRWALHCHNLYHMHAGMMTSLGYEA